MAAWDRQHPPVATPQLTFSSWLAGLPPTSDVLTWQSELVHGDGRVEPYDLGDPGWSWWGVPASQVAAVLDALASEGWSLVHVSEDKGLFSGATAGFESYPARIRYLLRRQS